MTRQEFIDEIFRVIEDTNTNRSSDFIEDDYKDTIKKTEVSSINFALRRRVILETELNALIDSFLKSNIKQDPKV